MRIHQRSDQLPLIQTQLSKVGAAASSQTGWNPSAKVRFFLWLFFFSGGRKKNNQGWANFQFVTVESLSTWRNQSRRVIGVHIRQLLMHSALSNTQAQPGSRDSRCVASSGIGTPPSAGRSVSDGGRRRRVIESSRVCSSVLLFLFSLIFITLTALCTIKYTLQLWKIKLGPWLSDYWNPMWAETFFLSLSFFSLHSFWHISRVVTREPEAAALKVLLRIGGGRAREKNQTYRTTLWRFQVVNIKGLVWRQIWQLWGLSLIANQSNQPIFALFLLKVTYIIFTQGS